jgi:hypothetical protein
MKKLIAVLLTIFIAGLAILFFARSFFALSLAKSQLRSIFPASAVSIGSCEFNPARRIAFKDIKIKRDNIYDLEIPEAGAYFSLGSVVRKNILRAYLKNARINISLGQKSLADFKKYLSLGPSVFLVSLLQLEDTDLSLRSKEANLKMRLSAAVDAIKQELVSINMDIRSLDSQGFFLKELILKTAQNFPQGEFSVREAGYDKAKASRITGGAQLKGKELSLNDMSASLFDGAVNLNVNLVMSALPQYSVDIDCKDLDIGQFVKDFKLEEKFQMTGRLSGHAKIKGSGADFQVIEGDFSTGEGGGVMVIKDEAMLKNMAQSSNQPLDIIVESLKDYHYNTGVMKLFKAQDSLGLDMALEGEKGKRNLTIVLHDFKLQ